MEKLTAKKIARHPDVVWREETEIRDKILEVLKRGEDDSSVSEQGTVSLVISGTIYQLNLLGGEIWKLSDGSLAVEGIADSLSSTFDIEKEVLLEDVKEFVVDLLAKGWLIYKDAL